MIPSNYKDRDGFILKFPSNCEEAEKKQLMKLYPMVDVIAKSNIVCTSCYDTFPFSPALRNKIKTHSMLNVTQCAPCYTFYHTGEFEVDNNGAEIYCRICGDGGTLLYCSICELAYCDICIETNLSKAHLSKVRNNKVWKCFVCNKATLKTHRAKHWALLNYLEKLLQKIPKEKVQENDAVRRPPLRRQSTPASVVTVKKAIQVSKSSTPTPSNNKTSTTSKAQSLPRKRSASVSYSSKPRSKRAHLNSSLDITTPYRQDDNPLEPFMQQKTMIPVSTDTPVFSFLSQCLNPSSSSALPTLTLAPPHHPLKSSLRQAHSGEKPKKRVRFSDDPPTYYDAPTTSLATTITDSFSFYLDNGKTVVRNVAQPNTPEGNIKAAFQDSMIAALGIAQGLTQKIRAISNSTLFNTSAMVLSELKELNEMLQLYYIKVHKKVQTQLDDLAKQIEQLQTQINESDEPVATDLQEERYREQTETEEPLQLDDLASKHNDSLTE